MMILEINEVFEKLIPKLKEEEFLQLEESIKDEGCRDPIVVWNGTIIDGHNRYSICTLHDIPFNTVERHFNNETEVKEWMYANQLGKRNITPDVASALRGKLYKSRKLSHSSEGKLNHQNEGSKTTAQQVAEETGVSKATVERDAKYDDALCAIEEANEELYTQIYNNEVKLTKAEVTNLGKKDADVIQNVGDRILNKEAGSVKQAYKIIEQEERAEVVAQAPAKEDKSLLLGSAPDMLKTLADNSVDLVLTDPPYGVDYTDTRDSFNPDYLDGKDYALKLLDDTCRELVRVVKPDAHLYFFFAMWNVTETKEIIGKYFDIHPIPLIWAKNNHTLCDFDKRYAPMYEPIWFCSSKGRSLNEKCSRDVLSFDTPRNKVHQAQKPKELLKYLIGNSTIEGETVLDCFAGSGSTLLSAKEMNRKYIGIEFDEDIYKIALEAIL